MAPTGRTARRERRVLLVLLPIAVACGVPSYGFDSADGGARTDSGAGLADSGPADSGVGPVDSGADGGPCICTEPPPLGWQGPVELYQGASPAPGCGGPYPVAAYNGEGDLTAPAAACAPCQCSSPAGSTCAATLQNLGAGCGMPSCPTFNLPAGACASIGSSGACSGDGVGYVPHGPTGSGGTCVSSGGTPTGTASFGSVGVACGPPAPLTPSGCASSQICAPAPSSGFMPSLCIEATGDVPCPNASAYSVPLVFYTALTDGRACSACTCASPACDGVVTTYASGSCTGTPSGSVGTGGGCLVPSAVSSVATFSPSTVSCAPSGGQPSGSVTGVSPVTFCCMP